METQFEYKTKRPVVMSLGVDPGIANTGYAIVTRLQAGRFAYVDSGMIKSKNDKLTGERVGIITREIREIMCEYSPTLCVVEDVFFNTNVSSCMSTGYVIGAVVGQAATLDIPVRMFTPQKVKMVVTGSRKANKRGVSVFSQKILGIKKQMPYHESDACAIALAGLLLK